MSKDKALDLALSALEKSDGFLHNWHENASDDEADAYATARQLNEKAITAIKQARSAPVQEPVWIQPDHLQKAQKAPFLCRVEPHKRDDFVPLYTTPPAAQRQWVWLTDEDIEQEFGFIDELLRDCVHRTEAKVREKNT